MPRYLIQVSLTTEGLKGTLAEGGTKRRAAVQELAESLGARVEAFYYAFGEHDIYVIVDAPDNVAGVAANLTVAAAGIARTNTVVLLTPEELDEAASKVASFRPPST